MKKALITGITGQDGSYLAELLLEKGYEVHGIIRRASVSTTERIDHILDKLIIHEGDLSDSSSIIRIVLHVKPDEIYNLAAQSHVQVSFEAAEYTGDVDALGVLRILEAVHTAGLDKTCRAIYNVGSGTAYNLTELLQYVTKLSHQPISIEVDPARFRPSDQPRICCDHRRITEELGWTPEYSVYDALREMYEAFLN